MPGTQSTQEYGCHALARARVGFAAVPRAWRSCCWPPLLALRAVCAAARPGAGDAGSRGAEPAADNSALDAPLFYQLLIGEIELRAGDAGTAYEVLLDAARRTRDEALFRRAVDIALQSRAGEQALAAARAWRSALPTVARRAALPGADPDRAEPRSPKLAEPLKALAAQARRRPSAPALITALPRLFAARHRPQAGARRCSSRCCSRTATRPDTRTAARVALGRAWLGAGDAGRALELAQRAPADRTRRARAGAAGAGADARARRRPRRSSLDYLATSRRPKPACAWPMCVR